MKNQIKTELPNFDANIKVLLTRYSKSKKPIEISFRDLVKNFNTERGTHLIHTYPAKLLAHIPYFFLNNNVFSKKGDTVLDPFCGSGTVLLESILSNRNAIGADTNPLARLISRVKTLNYDIEKLKKEKQNLGLRLGKTLKATTPDVINVDYWFLPHVKEELSIILKSIKKIRNTDTRDFFLICFSNCVKKVSLADPRVSVPVKLRKNQYGVSHPFRKLTNKKLDELETIDVREKFFNIVDSNIKRHSELKRLRSIYKSKVRGICNDSRNLTSDKRLKDESIDLIISSPPYAGAQKYIRSSSLNLGWLEFADSKHLKSLDQLTIGRENYLTKEYKTLRLTNIEKADSALKKIWKINPLRAHIAANYLVEMSIALRESTRVLKRGNYFILVAANNVICDTKFKTQEYLSEILINLGLKVELKLIDDIRSYGLMTKRNKTASVITREWITIFRKVK